MKPKSTPDRVLGLRFPRAFVQRMRAVQCMRPEMLRQGLKRTVEEAEASIRAALKDGSIQFVQPRFCGRHGGPRRKGTPRDHEASGRGEGREEGREVPRGLHQR